MATRLTMVTAMFVCARTLLAGATPTGSLPPSVADRPKSLEYCYQDQLALAEGPYLRALPAVGAKPSQIDAGDRCVEGDLAQCRRIPIDPADAWIAGARAGDWICLTNGREAGWTLLKEVALEPAPNRQRTDWVGRRGQRQAGDPLGQGRQGIGGDR